MNKTLLIKNQNKTSLIKNAKTKQIIDQKPANSCSVLFRDLWINKIKFIEDCDSFLSMK